MTWGQGKRLPQCNARIYMNGISAILFKLSLRSTMKSLFIARLRSATSSRLMKTPSLSSEEWRTQWLRHFMRGLLLIKRVRIWRGIPLRLLSLRSIRRTTFTQPKETTKRSTTCTYCEAQVLNDLYELCSTIGVSNNLPNWWKPSSSSCNSAKLILKSFGTRGSRWWRKQVKWKIRPKTAWN